MMHFNGMLFDLDGTLVKSLDFVEQSWGIWADRKGLNTEQVLQYLHGKPAISTLRHFMPDASDEVIAKEFTILEDYEVRHVDTITPVAGAVSFLSSLQALSVPWGIVTSGSLKVASARIKQAGLPFPSVLITSEDIQYGKPHPEPFLMGALKLNLSALSCIAFEDSSAGMISARQAGCVVVEVITPQSVAHDVDTYLTLADYQHISVQRSGGTGFFLKV
ncbi:HAD-IA family hydrolase [Klebsiella sp. BIGb0407]|uniref:HAD-IA family hydrolase n=1 Tax=Klebsiella sp. BIGb0407 TaxID=2940603 RepID=UPI00216A4651|nr:HAD-IA family hydrolase [Klebsiella sp. BIGb0407]MCS3432932.1 sugar-phosphatase [Klebsiella sp. BIGb0407]